MGLKCELCTDNSYMVNWFVGTLFDIIEAASICCIENLLESATEMAAKLNFK